MKRRDFLFAAGGATFGSAASLPIWLGSAQSEPSALGAYDQRLIDLGIELPEAPAPVATYAAWRKSGNLVFIAGQGPAFVEGQTAFGTLGQELSIQSGYDAARSAGLNVLAQLRESCGGSLNSVQQCLQLTGYVNSDDSFKDQPSVVNGASDLFVEVFGELGKGARAAVGVNTLPFNVAVEIESIWQIRD